MGDGAGLDIDDDVPVVGDDEAPGAGHLTDDVGLHLPLRADGQERVHLVRCDDRAHPLLRFTGQDLHRVHAIGPQRHLVQIDEHAAVPCGSEFRSGTRQPGRAEVLDPDHQPGGHHFEGAFDQHLLREGVADLDARQLATSRTGVVVVERGGGEHRRAADPVEAGGRPVEDHLVAGAGRLGGVEVGRAQYSDRAGVDQRVAGVRRVEHHLAADVGQPQRVPVPADPGNDPGYDALGVRRIGRAEPQLVHHGDRSRPHGEDVADDAADAGRRSLVGLDE